MNIEWRMENLGFVFLSSIFYLRYSPKKPEVFYG